MYYRILIPAMLVMFAIGCGGTPDTLTPEALELQSSSPDKYAEILAMSDEELTTSMKELTQKLTEKRSKLPPSLGQSKVGGGATMKSSEGADPVGVDLSDDGESIVSMALPLEVMRQEQNRREKD